MPEENGGDPSDFLSDVIPGGYKPSDCECYPCASTDGFPSGMNGDTDRHGGDLAKYRDLVAKVAKQEKEIAHLKKMKQELKNRL